MSNTATKAKPLELSSSFQYQNRNSLTEPLEVRLVLTILLFLFFLSLFSPSFVLLTDTYAL